MGDQLKLHPAVMLVGALVGFTLLGLPGLLLAGPIIATARLFVRYGYAKIFNLPPWPDAPEEEPAAAAPVHPVRKPGKKAPPAMAAGNEPPRGIQDRNPEERRSKLRSMYIPRKREKKPVRRPTVKNR
jgi:hypothetical protein